jgi:hypothetical protein
VRVGRSTTGHEWAHRRALAAQPSSSETRTVGSSGSVLGGHALARQAGRLLICGFSVRFRGRLTTITSIRSEISRSRRSPPPARTLENA